MTSEWTVVNHAGADIYSRPAAAQAEGHLKLGNRICGTEVCIGEDVSSLGGRNPGNSNRWICGPQGWVRIEENGRTNIRPLVWYDAYIPSPATITRTLILVEFCLIALPFVIMAMSPTALLKAFSLFQAFFIVPIGMQSIGVTSGLFRLVTRPRIKHDDENEKPLFTYGFMIPVYGEPIELLSKTLDALSRHPWAEYYIVVLAMEKRGENGKVATALTEAFKDKFGQIVIQMHPRDIPGEFQGKHTNCDWAARRTWEMCQMGHLKGCSHDGSDFILSVIDSDSLFPFETILELDARANECADASRALFRFTTVVTEGVETTGVLKWADTIEHCAQLTILTVHPIGHGMSAYGMTMQGMARHAQFWGTGFDAIGEDECMGYRAWLGMSEGGDFEPVTIWRPFYSSPMESELQYDGIMMRSNQHCRHAWGLQNLGMIVQASLLKQRHRFWALRTMVWQFTAGWLTQTLIPMWSLAHGITASCCAFERTPLMRSIDMVFMMISFTFILQAVVARQFSQIIQGGRFSIVQWVEWLVVATLCQIPIMLAFLRGAIKGHLQLYAKLGGKGQIKYIATHGIKKLKTHEE